MRGSLVLYRCCCWCCYCATADGLYSARMRLKFKGSSVRGMSVMARLRAMWLEVAKSNMTVPRSTYHLQSMDPQQYSRSTTYCTAVGEIFPATILECISTHKSLWHEELNTKRDCCCTRRGPRCELLYTAEDAKGCWSFVLCGFPSPCLALARRKAIPRKEPARHGFERPERATEPGRGPNLRVVSVQAGPLRAPQPRAREKTRGRKRRGC